MAFVKMGGCPVEIDSYEETLKALCKREAEKITVPAVCKQIGRNAFAEFQTLKELVFEEGVEDIGEDIIWGSNNVADVWLPSTVKTMHKTAFSQDDGSVKVTVHINKPKDELSGYPWNADRIEVKWGEHK